MLQEYDDNTSSLLRVKQAASLSAAGARDREA